MTRSRSNPAIASRSFDHRVLARNLIRGQRQIEAIAGSGNDIEIRHGRHFTMIISAPSFHVEFDLADGLA